MGPEIMTSSSSQSRIQNCCPIQCSLKRCPPKFLVFNIILSTVLRQVLM